MSTSININDHDALNAAFAEKVAGWTDVRHESGEDVDIDAREIYPWEGLAGSPPDGERRRLIPDFTRSMDAVLPWLEKENFEAWHYLDSRMGSRWRVEVGEEVVHAPTLPHAAVVALLRAKGVTVEEHAEPDKP